MKKALLVLGSALILLSSPVVEARGPGGGAGGGSSMGGGHPASGHSDSSRGYENSNGRNSADRDVGLDRARERMSAEGLSHEKATDNQYRRRSTESDSQFRIEQPPSGSFLNRPRSD